MADEAKYVLPEDYYEPLIDGTRDKLIFKAGQKIAWETAYQIGLVKTKTPPRAETGKTVKLELPEKDV